MTNMLRMDKYSLAPAVVATITLLTIAFLRRKKNNHEASCSGINNHCEDDEPIRKTASSGNNSMNSRDESPSATYQQAVAAAASRSSQSSMPPRSQRRRPDPNLALKGIVSPRAGGEDVSPPLISIKAKDSMEFNKEEETKRHSKPPTPAPPAVIQLAKASKIGLKANDSLEQLHHKLDQDDGQDKSNMKKKKNPTEHSSSSPLAASAKAAATKNGATKNGGSGPNPPRPSPPPLPPTVHVNPLRVSVHSSSSTGSSPSSSPFSRTSSGPIRPTNANNAEDDGSSQSSPYAVDRVILGDLPSVRSAAVNPPHYNGNHAVSRSSVSTFSNGGGSHRPSSPTSSLTPSMLAGGERSRIGRALKSASVLYQEGIITQEERKTLKSIILDQDERVLSAFDEYEAAIMDMEARDGGVPTAKLVEVIQKTVRG